MSAPKKKLKKKIVKGIWVFRCREDILKVYLHVRMMVICRLLICDISIHVDV